MGTVIFWAAFRLIHLCLTARFARMDSMKFLTALVISVFVFLPFSAMGDEEGPATTQGVLVHLESMGKKSLVDTRVQRLIGLHVPEHREVSPFLPKGAFRAIYEGFIYIELFDDFTFSLSGQGKVRLEIAGQLVLESKGGDLI